MKKCRFWGFKFRIKKKYFTSTGNRNWVFGCRDKDGKAATLVKASDTAIVRHVKIKGDANPFDPRWEAYFKDRIGRQMGLKEGNRKQVTRLWHDQNGNCQSCGEAITSQTRWTLQHIVPLAIGGLTLIPIEPLSMKAAIGWFRPNA